MEIVKEQELKHVMTEIQQVVMAAAQHALLKQIIFELEERPQQKIPEQHEHLDYIQIALNHHVFHYEVTAKEQEVKSVMMETQEVVMGEQQVETSKQTLFVLVVVQRLLMYEHFEQKDLYQIQQKHHE